MPRPSRSTRSVLTVAILASIIAVGGTVGVTFAAFSNTTSTPANPFSADPDWTAPRASATLLASATTGAAVYKEEVLADSPLTYWRMGDTSGTTLTDSSGNARNAALAGTGYTLDQAGGLSSSTDRSVAFAATDGRAEITDAALNLTTAFSLEAWIYSADGAESYTYFEKTVGGTSDTSNRLYQGGGRVKCRSKLAGANKDVQSALAPATNGWTYAVCTYDGSNMRLYLNGVAEVDVQAVAGPVDGGAGLAVLGRRSSGVELYSGRLDEFAVYGAALSQARITAHYNAGMATVLTDGLRQCESYYAYANVTDSGNPPSGVATVTANVSQQTAGETAAALTANSTTIGSTSYNYRKGPLFVDGAVGSPTWSLTMTDNDTNSRTLSSLTSTVLAAPAPPTALFLTGLEQGAISTTMSGAFSTVTGVGVTADADVKRNGAYSLKVAPTAAAASAEYTWPAVRFAVIRFAVRFASVPSSTVEFFRMTSGGAMPNLVYNSSTGKIGVRWTAGAITDGSVSLSAGTWYLIEARADLNANPHVFTWQVDGVNQATSGFAEGGKAVFAMRFGTAATTETYVANFDDILGSQTVADYPLKDGKVLSLRPDGRGTDVNPTHFQHEDSTAVDTTTWNRLDEVPPTLSDYVKQTTQNAASYVELSFEDTTSACVNGVGAVVAFHGAGTGANKGTTKVLDGATESLVGIVDAPMNTLTLDSSRATVTPATTWSTTSVNGLKARIGFSGDNNPIPYWDQVLLEYDVATG